MDSLEAEIEGRLKQFEQGVGRYYKPLTDAADEFIRFAQTPDLRVFTGIKLFDDRIRGVAPGEMCLINGFAHSGKTVLATEILLANSHEPMILFTPDETRPAVLTKLAAAETGVAALELEQRIFRQDEAARSLLLGVATKFHQLAVYDENVSLHQMDVMLEEAATAFGKRPKAVLFDYAEQLNESTDTKGKLDELKRWGKNHKVALFVLHQTSRSAGAGGKELGIDSGNYGGEQQATFLIVVRRKINYFKDRIMDLEHKLNNATNPQQQSRYMEQIRDIIDFEIPRHRNTVSIGLVKNKRPPMDLVAETDFTLDPETGRLFLIGDGGGYERDEDLVEQMNLAGLSARSLLSKDD